MNHNRKPLIFTAILHVSVKYIYGAERIKSLTFQRNLWWQSEKEHGRAEASIVILSELSHPNTFRLFPELSLRNHRITLLQSLSKHRQIPPPYQALAPSSDRMISVARQQEVRAVCLSSPLRLTSNTCPGCVNDPYLFEKHVSFLFFTSTSEKISQSSVMPHKCQLQTFFGRCLCGECDYPSPACFQTTITFFLSSQ